MITAEMKNNILREQILAEIKEIKREMEELKKEISELKQNVRYCDHDWCADEDGVYCSICGDDQWRMK